MFADWLEKLLTTCPEYLRDMGCLGEMLGIRRRRNLFRHTWQPHCDRSRSLILRAMAACSNRRKAVILGSGWLNDVPVEELSATFDNVYLVDLFHPFSVRRAMRQFPNIHLIAHDITGTLEAVWRTSFEYRDTLPLSTPTLIAGTDEADWTVSLNILSQLPCMPESYLRRNGHYDERKIGEYCRQLIRAHVAYLQSLPGVVTLIADTEVVTRSTAGQEVHRESTLYGVEFPWQGEHWEWVLVPKQSRWPHHAEVLQVTGIANLRSASRRGDRDNRG